MNTTQNKLADALRLARTELEQWLPNEAADDATNAALEAVCAALAEHDAESKQPGTMKMDVKVIVGSEAAYACAKWGAGSLDVRLPAGKSAADGLREVANDEMARAVKGADRAKRIMDMALALDGAA